MSAQYDAIIIGAGQAGLAAGYFLKRYGLHFVLLDRNPQVGGSWQHYWDSLRLFSPARYSRLPGLPFPGDPDRLPTRYEMLDYLRGYAAHFDLPAFTGAVVERVQRADNGLRVFLEGQPAPLLTRTVIVAGGAFNRPYIPALPGAEAYGGRVLHSYDYHEPSAFAGQRVIVVGANNSAVQIGHELARVARVALATRRPIQWLPRRILGLDLFAWIHATGFDMLPLGWLLHLRDTKRVIDDGTYRRAIAAGRPDARPMFTGFTSDGVIWPDGTREAVDAVVFATGYRPDNVPFLAGTGALCPHDHTPLQRGGASTTVPGLYFVGRFGQLTTASATVRGAGLDARTVAWQLRRYLRQF